MTYTYTNKYLDNLTNKDQNELRSCIAKDDVESVTRLLNGPFNHLEHILYPYVCHAIKCQAYKALDLLIERSADQERFSIKNLVEDELYTMPVHQVCKKHSLYTRRLQDKTLNVLLIKRQYDVANDIVSDPKKLEVHLLNGLTVDTFYTMLERTVQPSVEYQNLREIYSISFQYQYIKCHKQQILSYFVTENRYALLDQYIQKDIFVGEDFVKYNIRMFKECTHEQIISVLEKHGMKFDNPEYMRKALSNKNIRMIDILRRRNNPLTHELMKQYIFESNLIFLYIIEKVPFCKYERMLKYIFFKLECFSISRTEFFPLDNEAIVEFLVRVHPLFIKCKWTQKFSRAYELATEAYEIKEKKVEQILKIIKETIVPITALNDTVVMYVLKHYL